MSTIYVNTINPQSGTEVSVGGSVSGSSDATFVTGITTAGPLNVTGTITAQGIASGSRGGDKSYVVLNASNQLVLDEGGGSAGLTQANQGNNRVITSVDATNINAEANLSFNGSTLAVTGDTSGSARGIFVTGLTTAGPLNVTGTATFAGDATVGDDLSLTSDAAILNFGAGNDVTFTHDGGTGMNIASAGDFDIAVSAGDATFTVADTKTLILGQTGASELKLSPHSTAGSELASLINTSGDTDGSDAAGAILLSSVAGGIGLAWADDKILHAEGGKFDVISNLDNAKCIKLHADAGSSQTIQIINDEGTTDGAVAAGALDLQASLGGIGLGWSDSKDLWAEGGRAVITANEDAADCIKLHADAGTAQTINVLNDAGTTMNAIGLTSSAGGITLDADLTTLSGSVRLYESKLSFSTGSLSPYVQYKTPSDGGQLKHRLVIDAQPYVGAYSTSGPIIEFSASVVHLSRGGTTNIGNYGGSVNFNDPVGFSNSPYWMGYYNSYLQTHTTNGTNYGSVQMNLLKPTGSMNIALADGSLGSTCCFVLSTNGFNATIIPTTTVGDWTSIVMSELGQSVSLTYMSEWGGTNGWFITSMSQGNAQSGSISVAATGSNNAGLRPQVVV